MTRSELAWYQLGPPKVACCRLGLTTVGELALSWSVLADLGPIGFEQHGLGLARQWLFGLVKVGLGLGISIWPENRDIRTEFDVKTQISLISSFFHSIKQYRGEIIQSLLYRKLYFRSNWEKFWGILYIHTMHKFVIRDFLFIFSFTFKNCKNQIFHSSMF